ncbi:hypothetical protein JTE90_001667 [Oedothorax gibbosus]|uniref:Uncharacterized protein n=1 Tax=Oedothorax gibbosus TaxID=931172 RepID=A0AAV6UUN9_9ARAC|nr:hypothetical protein JTE90_001667 [Oedothorax gibbosus]
MMKISRTILKLCLLEFTQTDANKSSGWEIKKYMKEEISYKRFTMKTVLIIIVLVFILASQVECKKNTLDCSLVKVKCKVPECDNPIYDTSVSCCQFCPGDHGTNG